MTGVNVQLSRFVDAVAARFDDAIGAGHLKPGTRTQLLAEQMQAVYGLTPVLAAASLSIAFVLLWAARAEAAFAPLLVWFVALCVVITAALQRSNAGLGFSPVRAAAPQTIRRAIYYAATGGAVWGVVPFLLLPSDSPTLKLATGIATLGIMCAFGFALSVLPVIAIAFAGPLLLGIFWGIWRLDDPAEAVTMTLLVAGFAATILLVGLRISRIFVRHLASESRIREQKDIISLLLKEFEESASDWLWEFDRSGRMERVSERFATAAGVRSADLLGLEFCSFLAGASAENAQIVAGLRRDIGQRTTFQDVVVKVEREGEENWWRLTGKPAFDDLGRFAGYIGTASNITIERLAERKINFLAHNDALTGLLNRSMFTDHLRQYVARLDRYGSPFTVLYLDLDQFKAVNDSRGHMIGDSLLAGVSRRIRGALRETDIAARLGGDEFAIILTQNCDEAETAAVANRLVDAISAPYNLGDHIVTIGVSIGIARAPIDGARADQLLRNADLALYRAKAEGKGTYRFFEAQMDDDVRARRLVESELRAAIDADAFVLHYQPLVSAEDDRPTGFEALVRWNHPTRGLVPPSEFIPIAEQSGLIRQIGDWTIREACHAAASWPEELLVAVNLSARHFQLTDIVAVVRAALDETMLPPHRLELEITESLLIENPDEVVLRLQELKALGVTIAMDDFGTGYSSLSYLLKFPFDKIKIDKSFVTASSTDPVARDILRSIASLGRTLKIRITAEGVETGEQVEFLRGIACNQLQGFYFARPLDEIELAGYFLREFRKTMAPVRSSAATALSAG